jgi:peptidoglycan-N-acetylglucosamine deacetylase
VNRREFTTGLAMGAVAFGLGGNAGSRNIVPAKSQRRVAVTMDDFDWNKSVRLSPDQRNEAILGHLRAHGNLKATMFVAGKFVDNEKGKGLLRAWADAGHTIGNHSYSHKYLNSSKVTAEIFTSDILKCEAVLAVFSRYQKRFRFPFLKER